MSQLEEVVERQSKPLGMRKKCTQTEVLTVERDSWGIIHKRMLFFYVPFWNRNMLFSSLLYQSVSCMFIYYVFIIQYRQRITHQGVTVLAELPVPRPS